MAWSKGKSRRKSELPPNWAEIRRIVLDRDGRRCQFCGAPATDVDHIRPGSDHTPSNLRALCKHCHMQRTAYQGLAARAKKGYKKRTHRPPKKHPGLL